MGILNFAKFSNQKGRARCGLTAEAHFTHSFLHFPLQPLETMQFPHWLYFSGKSILYRKSEMFIFSVDHYIL